MIGAGSGFPALEKAKEQAALAAMEVEKAQLVSALRGYYIYSIRVDR